MGKGGIDRRHSVALVGQEVKVEGVVCPGKPRGDWGSARASGHTECEAAGPGRACAGRWGLSGYSRTQGQPPPFFLGAVGGLGGSSCSWYFLWEAVCKYGLEG